MRFRVIIAIHELFYKKTILINVVSKKITLQEWTVNMIYELCAIFVPFEVL